MSYVGGYPYTREQEYAILNKSLPDAILAARIGITPVAVRLKRRRLQKVVVERPPVRATDEERAEVAREEIVALQARIEETEALLCELGRMLIAARKRLVRLT